MTSFLNTEILRSSNLEGALPTRQVIGQAEGLLIEHERNIPVRAFDVLRRTSQNLNVKLKIVAQQVVDTGEVPDR